MFISQVKRSGYQVRSFPNLEVQLHVCTYVHIPFYISETSGLIDMKFNIGIARHSANIAGAQLKWQVQLYLQLDKCYCLTCYP